MTRPYLMCADVMNILGCAQNNAYKIIKLVNEYAVKKNLLPFPQGRANKYLFADLYGIPVEVIDQMLKEDKT